MLKLKLPKAELHSHHDEKEEEEEAAVAAPIHGDILETILSHVPLIDLVLASQVSKSWNIAVYSSLRRFNTIKPWFTVHSQNTRSPYSSTTYMYDPRSHLWIQIKQQPSIKYFSALRSSHSTLLYMLSPSKFSFSLDPMRLIWHHADAPLIWRKDPIVAHVGHCIVMAGGTCDFEDDPLAVEIYDLMTHKWDTCDSMPAFLKDSASSTWLSIAVDETKLYVSEKSSGIAYWFDPNSKTWHGPYDLLPDRTVFNSVIGFVNNYLIVVGLLGNAENVKGIKMWEVSGELLECKKEIGEVPKRLVEKLNGDGISLTSIAMTAMGDFVYIHKPSDPEEVIQCEIVKGRCRWNSIPNVAVNDGGLIKRVVMTCANVGMGDLYKAIREKLLNKLDS